MYLKNSLIVILFFVLSCQPVEILKPVEIDISNFEKISINTKEIEINTMYNPVFAKNNIEDQIQNPPIDIIIIWNNENIIKLGNENKLKEIYLRDVVDLEVSTVVLAFKKPLLS